MTTSAGDRRARGTRGVRRLTVLAAVLAVLVTAACGGTETAKPAGGATTAPETTASETTSTDASVALADGQYVENAADFVDAADWDAATNVVIDMGEMYFEPKDVTLEAGKPYVLELVNSGAVEHEFVAEGFFRSVATRKIETADAEVEVPFFTETEVFAGKTVELLVIPVIPGTYAMLCEIPGHREAGMEGTITVTGSAPTEPAPVIGDMTAGPWLQNGPEIVEAASETWDAKVETIRIEAGEDGAAMFFEPKKPVLKVGTPYVLELVNVGKIVHMYDAPDFFATVAFRKAQDAEGEYKGPLLKDAEVFSGKQLDLYLIPTKAGTFEIFCEIEGHREAGMEGTITVTE